MSQITLPGRSGDVPTAPAEKISIGRSMIWKQLRDYRNLLICVLLVLAVFPFLLRAVADSTTEFWDLVHPLIAALSCGTAVAIAVLTFVDERERGTKELLSQFPVGAGQMAGLKMGCSLAAMLFYLFASLAITVLVAFVEIGTSASVSSSAFDWDSMSGWLEKSSHELIFNFAIVVFVFGISSLCSIRSRTSLTALLTTAAGGVVGCLLLSAIANWLSVSRATLLWMEPLDFLILVAGIGLIVLAFLAAPTWLRRPAREELGSMSGLSIGSFPNGFSNRGSARLGVLSSLLWQSFHQQKRLMLFLGGMMLAVFGVVFFVSPQGNYLGVEPAMDFGSLLLLTLGAFAFSGFALAVGSVYHDKRGNRFFFFREHREFGRWFWISRVLFPLGFLLLSSMLFVLVSSEDNWALVGGFVGLSAFALTLIISFLLSSLVYSSVIGLLGSVGCLAMGFVFSQMDIGAIDVAMLMPAGWLAISFLYSKQWISGVHPLVQRIAMMTLAFAVLSGSLMLVRQHRLDSARVLIGNWNSVFAAGQAHLKPKSIGIIGHDVATLFAELAEFDSGRPRLEDYDFSQFERADELVSAMMQDPLTLGFYSSQLGQLDADAYEWGYLKSQKLLEDAAAKRANTNPVEQFLILRALSWQNRFVNRGRRDQVSKKVLAWITNSNRTETELRQAIDQLQSYSAGHVLRLVEATRTIRWEQMGTGERAMLVPPALRYIPWEKERALRIADAYQIPPSYVLWFDAASKPDGVLDDSPWNDRFERMADFFSSQQLIGDRQDQTDYLSGGLVSDVNATVLLLQDDRYLILRAALEVYRIRNGRYPEGLEELFPEILTSIPVCVSGDSFCYRRPAGRYSILLAPIPRAKTEFVLLKSAVLLPYMRTKSEWYANIDDLKVGLNEARTNGRIKPYYSEELNEVLPANVDDSSSQPILLITSDVYSGFSTLYRQHVDLPASNWVLEKK